MQKAMISLNINTVTGLDNPNKLHRAKYSQNCALSYVERAREYNTVLRKYRAHRLLVLSTSRLQRDALLMALAHEGGYYVIKQF